MVAGAGVMRRSDRFGDARFSSHEGAVIGGDVRLGWELHARAAGIVGWTLGT